MIFDFLGGWAKRGHPNFSGGLAPWRTLWPGSTIIKKQRWRMADKAFATLAATSLWAMTMKIPTFFRTTDSNLSGFWKYKWVGQATRMQVISDPRLITKDLFMEYN